MRKSEVTAGLSSTVRPTGRAIRRHFPAAAVLAAAILLPGFSAPVQAWDSTSFAARVIHPTHSYLTEYAIDQLKNTFPELETYRRQLVEGANTEEHELPVTGTAYGIDLEAKRIEHKGTNEGTDDIAGWWQDAVAAYKAGNLDQAFLYTGIMLHMIEDMGVPAHANHLYHQGNLTEFDNFEFMALSNWKPSFADINRSDPGFADPSDYYQFSGEWTRADAPDYLSTSAFSKTWTFASRKERALLQNRQGRTAIVATWALAAAMHAFGG